MKLHQQAMTEKISDTVVNIHKADRLNLPDISMKHSVKINWSDDIFGRYPKPVFLLIRNSIHTYWLQRYNLKGTEYLTAPQKNQKGSKIKRIKFFFTIDRITEE